MSFHFTCQVSHFLTQISLMPSGHTKGFITNSQLQSFGSGSRTFLHSQVLGTGSFQDVSKKWGGEWDIRWWLYTQSWTNQDAVLYVKTYVNAFCTLQTRVGVFVWTIPAKGWSATRLLRANFDTFSESAAESFIQFEADKISKGGLISWQCNTLDLSIHMIG